ncbi:hypothetical protein BpHYR1_011715, partial [Brachionus plicatilis]
SKSLDPIRLVLLDRVTAAHSRIFLIKFKNSKKQHQQQKRKEKKISSYVCVCVCVFDYQSLIDPIKPGRYPNLN